MAGRFKALGIGHNFDDVGAPSLVKAYNGKPVLMAHPGKGTQRQGFSKVTRNRNYLEVRTRWWSLNAHRLELQASQRNAICFVEQPLPSFFQTTSGCALRCCPGAWGIFLRFGDCIRSTWTLARTFRTWPKRAWRGGLE